MNEGAETLRSRLYRLQTQNGQQAWIQKGEGYPQFKRQQNLFRLRYYTMPGRDTLYDITVDTNIQFQRSENGIQWTQIKQNEVMAISFKQQFSANAFWQLIEQYQRKYAISVPAADGIYFYFQYKVPDPTVNNLKVVLKQLQNIPQNERHQRVTSIFLTKRDLLPRLLSVFKKLEQSKQYQKLEQLFSIIKIIFNASNEELFYELMCNQSFMGVLGILEYDPNFRTQRPKHREFIFCKSKLLEVVPFRYTPQLQNIVVFTYRLQYVRQCVLFPYLNDNGFGSSGCIIRNNYKKIFNHIFSAKKKDFINSLYDLLRMNNVQAFKLLRQLFRIARVHYMPQIYNQIAQKDTFQIFINVMKELQQNNGENTKKKKKPQQLQKIIMISLEILEQYMEHQSHHVRQFCLSQSQKVLKYPACKFLLTYFQNNSKFSEKIGNILCSLFGYQNNLLKQNFKKEIVDIVLKQNQKDLLKWVPIFSQVLLPFNTTIAHNIQTILNMLISLLKFGSKTQQISNINTLKIFLHTYFIQQETIFHFLVPKAAELNKYLCSNKLSSGIRVSAFLAVFLPKKFGILLAEMIKLLQQEAKNNILIKRYVDVLSQLKMRRQIVLPNALKRDKSQQFLDEQNFQKLSKKIKID